MPCVYLVVRGGFMSKATLWGGLGEPLGCVCVHVWDVRAVVVQRRGIAVPFLRVFE